MISYEPIEGQYFIRVKGKGHLVAPGATYMVNYYYYNQEEVMPYRLIDLQSADIGYTLSTEGITFSMRPILVKNLNDSAIKDYSVQYQFYFSSNRDTVDKYANCRLDSVTYFEAETVSQDLVTLTLKVILILCSQRM